VKGRPRGVTRDSEVLLARFGPVDGGIDAVVIDSKLVTDA